MQMKSSSAKAPQSHSPSRSSSTNSGSQRENRDKISVVDKNLSPLRSLSITTKHDEQAFLNKLNSVPTLSSSFPRSPKPLSMNDSDFINSIPVFRRERYDVFGSYDLPPLSGATPITAASDTSTESSSPSRRFVTRFSLNDNSHRHRTVVKKTPSEGPSSSKKALLSNDPRRRDSYAIKSTAGDIFMRSEGERKEGLELAVQKKKDKADQLFKRKKTPKPPKSPPKSPFSTSRPLTSAGDDDDHLHPFGATNAAEVDASATATVGSLEREQDELTRVFDQYFGDKSRLDFNLRAKEVQRDLDRYLYQEDLPAEKTTPRSVYLRETAQARLLPLPLILRKETNPLGIFLGHKGLGDVRMAPVIKVLGSLPAIHSIDLCDNRLTDATLMPLALKLGGLPHLTLLDLSFNKMDESSRTIMDYLRSDACRLRTLLLNGADVDDGECANLAEALTHNRSVRTLGLNNNLIGKKELLNVLYPDLVTGGEALGDMLRVNSTLTRLDLSWNSLRLDSAIAIALSLEVNTSLRTLLLGYNSFGDMPSQVLGRTLKGNTGLTELDVECNSITPKACTVLANAISFNETLLSLNINGNILGKIGAQALVAAIQRSSSESRKLQVSFVNCDCVQDDDNIFSAANPHGTWRLDLAEPYGQMVAAECLYLANYKAGCRIVRLLHNGNLVTLERSFGSGGGSGGDGEEEAVKRFRLEEFYKNCRMAAKELLTGTMADASRALQVLLTQFDFKMAEEQRLLVLEKTLTLWNAKAKREGRDDLQEVFLYEVFFALFVINDTDLSGTMELDEFLETLASLGKPDFDRDAARRMMAEHDRDESGSIDANEFGTIMLNEFCRTEMPKGDLVDASTGKPWEIPPTGACVIQLSYQCDVPTVFDIGQDYGIDNIIRSIREAKTDDQREILFQNTTSSPYFFLSFDQAQLLFEEMQGLNRLPLELMASILPQIVNEEQACKFIETNLNERGKLALRVKLGTLYNSYVGLHTGHYVIDMKQPDQRNGGRRLGAICVTEGKFCRSSGVQSSQKGNNSNFRNEKLGYTPVEVTGRWFASVATTKVLRCDYVSTTRPRKGMPPMTDSRLDRLLQQLQWDDIRRVHQRVEERDARVRAMEELAQQQRDAGEDNSGAGSALTTARSTRQSIFTPSVPQSGAGTPAIRSRCNTGLDEQAEDQSAGGDPIKGEGGEEGQKEEKEEEEKEEEFPELAIEAPLSVTGVRDFYAEYVDSSHHHHDIYPEERMRDVSWPGYSAADRPATPEDMRLPPGPDRLAMPPVFPLAYRRLLELQIVMPNLYMSVAQLTVLLRGLPPDVAYLRVLLLQSVFSHITDLENMHTVIDSVLTPDERTEAFHRIGIMNLLDPMRPDRLYRLDLRRVDHREWVKVLVTLAVTEPGENWEQVEYRWGRYDEPVPGWTLPSTWTFEDDGGYNGGPRNHGWLRVYYRSTGNGCMPVMSVRKYLRKRTLAGMKRII